MKKQDIRKQFSDETKQQCVLYQYGYGFSDDYCLWLEKQLIKANKTIKYLRESAVENMHDNPIIDDGM